MGRNTYLAILATPLLCGWLGCAMPSSPSGTDGSAGRPGSATDICNTTPDLGFDFVAAGTVPVLDDDLTLGVLGVDGARALIADGIPDDLFCSYVVSPSVQAIIDQAEILTAAGQNAAARALLASLLIQLKAGNGFPKPINARLDDVEENRQRIQDLVEAGQADRRAGGDGQDFDNAANDVFGEWAKKNLPNATLDEAGGILSEALFLKHQELEDDARERVKELALDSLNELLIAFNPCTASDEEVTFLLVAIAKAMGWGALPGDDQDVFQPVAEAYLRLGVSPEEIEQTYGYHISAPVCDAVFAFVRTVSVGLTLSGEGSTCGGGLWEGTIALEGTTAGAEILSSGEFTFRILTGDDGAVTTIETFGTFGTPSELLPFTDPLQMTFFLGNENQSADISIASTGAGLIFTEIGPLTFASVFTTNPEFTVDLLPNPDCPAP